MRRIAYPIIILLLVVPSIVHAQAARSSLYGTVIDNTTEAPISGARVQLFDALDRPVAQVVADSLGRFLFSSVRQGPFSLRASRIGYHTAQTPVWRVEADERLDLEIRLDQEAVPLAPLTVVASIRRVGPSPMLANYRARLESGFGSYITRADIERNPRSLITDHLGTVPGVQLVTSGAGFRRTVYMNRARPGRDCPAQVYIDGRPLNRGANVIAIDDAVSPANVEGIEIYRGLAGVPAEFMSPEAPCGVIAIWTRRGDREAR